MNLSKNFEKALDREMEECYEAGLRSAKIGMGAPGKFQVECSDDEMRPNKPEALRNIIADYLEYATDVDCTEVMEAKAEELARWEAEFTAAASKMRAAIASLKVTNA
ncbi:MAG: hypothetical protein V4637_07365 [Pseudomonadota bacterium]